MISMRVFFISGLIGAVMLLFFMTETGGNCLKSDPCDRHPGYKPGIASSWNSVPDCEGWEEYIEDRPWMED